MEGTAVLRSSGSHQAGGPGMRLFPGLTEVPLPPPQMSDSSPRASYRAGLHFSSEELDLIPSVPGRFHVPRKLGKHEFAGSRESLISGFSVGSSQSGLGRHHVARNGGGGLWASEPWQRRDSVTRRQGALPRTLPPMDMDGTQSAPVAGVHRRNMATALFMSVASSRYSKVSFLLNNGVERDVVNDAGQNLLISSLYIHDTERRERMFRYLIKKGVDPCYVDSEGRDVLSWAASLGRAKEVSAILEAAMGEIDVLKGDKEKRTPLHHATIGNHEQVARILLGHMEKYKLPVDVPDVSGLTPFIYARRMGHHEIAHVLLTIGQASQNQIDSVTFKSAEEWAMIGAKERARRYKTNRRHQMAQFKIRGKLPPLPEDKGPVPTISLTGSDRQTGSDGTSSKTSISASDSTSGSGSKFLSVKTKRRNVAPMETGHAHRANNNGSISNRSFGVASVDQVDSGMYRAPSLAGSLHSVSNFHNLIDLQTETSTDLAHPAHFVSSEVDTARAAELGIMGSLNDMMTIASEQASSAFREVAIPRPPSPPKPVVKKKKKKNVSTLAILMGKNNTAGKSGKRVKKSTVAAAGRKKSLADHAKEKRKKGKK